MKLKHIVLAGALVPAVAFGAAKFLHHQFNKNVDIVISNVECPVKELKAQYPNAAVALRSDGQRLFGCFTHRGDIIVIQWAGGDTTELPANYFLAEKLEPNT